VADRAGLQPLHGRALPAEGLVVARGVVGEERAVVAGDEVAAQDREGRGVGEGFGDVGAEARAAEAVELVPVAVEAIVVERAVQAQGLVGFRAPLEVGAPVLGDMMVEAARAVAAVGVRAQVGLAEAGVGFVGVEIGLPDLQFEAARRPRRRGPRRSAGCRRARSG